MEKSEKRFVLTLILAIFLGNMGIHRFYVGKIGTGILMLITFGGLAIWYIVDIIMIATGSFKDKEGRAVRKRNGEFRIIWFFVSLPFKILFFPFKLLFGNKVFCAWCGKKNIQCTKGIQGDWIWEYRNKGGGRDKRVKNNFQKASYESYWSCDDCGAETYVKHFLSKNPSSNSSPSRIELSKNGSGERKAENKRFEGTTVYANKENRIGKG